MWMIAQYLKYATKAEYLSYRIQLTLLRTSKTKEMVICLCKDRTYVESLTYIDINGTDIERVTQAKVLGVIISSDLSWHPHVDEIVAKARKRVYMIYQLKCAGINQNDLGRIYVSVIRPVVEYACLVWHTNLPKYLSDNIEIISKLYFLVLHTRLFCRW